jgi:hypothetical protein
MRATIEYNFGIRIHYYARVGFDGFVRIVDALGGLDIPVECPLSDTFPDPDAPEGRTDVDWLPGIHHMDGKQALWYARSRWSTSDFDRNRRQQQVLRAMYQRLKNLGIISKIPDLWTALRENVATDLELDDLIYLGLVGSQLDLENVKSRFIGRGFLQSWTSPKGAYVLVPDYEAIGAVVAEALTPPAVGRANRQPFRVEVWNAGPYSELGFVAAERLRWEGLEVTEVQLSERSYARTQIVDFTSSTKGSPLPLLMRLYGRRPEDVANGTPFPDSPDFQVYLGLDYNPCVRAEVIQYVTQSATPTPLPPAFFPTTVPQVPAQN